MSDETDLVPDSFYQDILNGLDKKLDHDEFERCVVELLRGTYPGIVLVPGGNDGGMDGAIPDGLGPSFPLVITTSKEFADLKKNLKKNLQSYLKRGGQRRKAVFASSRKLTSGQIRKLEETAEKMGVKLVQVFGREQLAPLLYRRPDLCKSLLNLSSAPPALSTISENGRVDTEAKDLRSSETEWALNQRGDRLIIGTPGSGKTYLLQSVQAKLENAFFVLSDDEERLSESIRRLRPTHLIVDDVQLPSHRRRLELCLKLRNALTGADFKLVVSSWPPNADETQRGMGLRSDQVKVLEPLTREQIAEIVKGAGLENAPLPLLREIVDQAEGRPGLAATLTRFCLAEDWEEVGLGKVLRRYALGPLEDVYGKKMVPALAALSLTGDDGLTLESLRDLTGLQTSELWEWITVLDSVVVVEARRRHGYQVRPPALRPVLVREYYDKLPVELMETVARIPGSAPVEVLVEARAVGAHVRCLEDILEERGGSDRVWRSYARIGRQEARHVLDRYPEKLTAAAPGLLINCPEETIEALLDASVGDLRALDQTPEHPLRKLKTWLRTARYEEIALERRSLLAKITKKWAVNGGDVGIAVRTLCLALQPGVSWSETDVSDSTITTTSGLLSSKGIRHLSAIWKELVSLLQRTGWEDWSDVLEQVAHWRQVHMEYRVVPTGEQRVALDEVVAEAVSSLLAIGPGPGVTRSLNERAKELGLPTLPVDPEFDVLFPTFDRMRDQEPLKALAQSWKDQDPEKVARRLVKLEKEARDAGLHSSLLNACTILSRIVKEPLRWLRAFLRVRPDSTTVGPFLAATAVADEPGWRKVATQLFQSNPDLRGTVVVSLLPQLEPDDELYELLEPEIPDIVNNLDILIFRDKLSAAVVERLLRHPDHDVRLAAISGEWNRDGAENRVRPELKEAWTEAILSVSGDQDRSSKLYWLENILASDREVAFDWLKRKLHEERRYPWIFSVEEELIQSAASKLEDEQVMKLLKEAPRTVPSVFIAKLIGDRINVYSWFLEQDAEAEHHLAPLTGMPDQAWIDKAKLALKSGYGPSGIVEATFPANIYFWSGSESKMWGTWVEAFQEVEKVPELSEVGRIGREEAESRRLSALEEERYEEVYGR